MQHQHIHALRVSTVLRLVCCKTSSLKCRRESQGWMLQEDSETDLQLPAPGCVLFLRWRSRKQAPCSWLPQAQTWMTPTAHTDLIQKLFAVYLQVLPDKWVPADIWFLLFHFLILLHTSQKFFWSSWVRYFFLGWWGPGVIWSTASF